MVAIFIISLVILLLPLLISRLLPSVPRHLLIIIAKITKIVLLGWNIVKFAVRHNSNLYRKKKRILHLGKMSLDSHLWWLRSKPFHKQIKIYRTTNQRASEQLKRYICQIEIASMFSFNESNARLRFWKAASGMRVHSAVFNTSNGHHFLRKHRHHLLFGMKKGIIALATQHPFSNKRSLFKFITMHPA